jgi:hypothetical protein
MDSVCKNCRFWEPLFNPTGNPPAPAIGRCHAGPPVTHDWPQKEEDDWCGQFQEPAAEPLRAPKQMFAIGGLDVLDSQGGAG